MKRFVYSNAGTVESATEPPQEPRARVLIRDAFRERISTLPREIRPAVYADLLEEIGVRYKAE